MTADKQNQGSKRPDLSALWPEIWGLMRPRRRVLLTGLMLMAVNRLSGIVIPLSTKFLIDDIIGQKRAEYILPFVGAVVAASLVNTGTSYASTQLLAKAAQQLIAELRLKLQAHIVRLPVSFYDRNKSGSLVARVMSDVEGLRHLVGAGLIDITGGLLTSFLAGIALLRISPLLTVVAFGCAILYGLGLRWKLRAFRPMFRERGRINAEVTGRLAESFGGVRVVKGYHAEEREARVFAAGVQRLLDNLLATLNATSLTTLMNSLVTGCVGAIVMSLGASHVLSGAMTLGEFMTFTALLAFVVAPAMQAVQIGTQLSEALAGLERSREVLRVRPEDLDPERRHSLPFLRGDVRFEGVYFGYESGKPVLHGIDFHAWPGSITALVGSSGSGKSTIAALVAAFHVPHRGRVLVDGIDLSTVRLDSYRTQLGVVLQESFLFDGTIRENVAFSRPEASDEEIVRACRLARVDEFAERFHHGYHTTVGERGVKLSGGQKQRVAIARAILADPRILMLDEATSSLDSESEALIQQGLEYLMRGRTTFVIAHRLSTVRGADQILVLESGSIVQRGTHRSLYTETGRYQTLYTQQYGLEPEAYLVSR